MYKEACLFPSISVSLDTCNFDLVFLMYSQIIFQPVCFCIALTLDYAKVLSRKKEAWMLWRKYVTGIYVYLTISLFFLMYTSLRQNYILPSWEKKKNKKKTGFFFFCTVKYISSGRLCGCHEKIHNEGRQIRNLTQTWARIS